MTNSSQLEPAYILHTRSYRDTSLILDVLTKNQGRISLLAKGIKRSRKNISSAQLARPFLPLFVQFSSGLNLRILRSIEARDRTLSLQGNSLLSAMYMNEVLVRTLQADAPTPAVFSLYEESLKALGSDTMIDVCLRHFEFNLLDCLGYGIDLSHDTELGETLRPECHYRYVDGEGLKSYAYDKQRDVHECYSGADILNFINGNFSKASRRTMKQLARQALAPHLGSRPLKSRELFGIKK